MLEQVQSAFMAALNGGPARMPFDLFAHPPERALLGMKIHANTVSHARLVALEDTFPRTRSRLGEARFNALSRRYLDRPGVAALGLTGIGRHFPLFLAETGEADDCGDLAAFEWAWLTSYNAADARALALVDLAGLDAQQLLAMRLSRHPAALLGPASPPVCAELCDLLPDLASACSVLLTRPEADVTVHTVDRDATMLFAKLDTGDTIGNLFAVCTEPVSGACIAQDRFMAALMLLIGAGALQGVE